MRIAVYTRVSTQEQARDGYSIDEQIDRLTKYCEAMKWDIYKIYNDAGFSGATTDRPALQRIIKDIKKGKIDKVLVYKLDRLSRSQKDTLELIEDQFIANGVEFVSMSENFDTSTAFGRAMVGILAVFAQLEREQIKERMSMGREARAKEGKFHGSSKPPIGYDYIDGKLMTNEFEKMQIQMIYEMYVSGMGGLKIAKKMNESGYSTKYGNWRHQTITELIPKKTYIGYVQFNGEWYKGEHEAFITEELYDKAQLVLEQRKKEHKINIRTGKATTYLAGYLHCSCCGSKYGKRCKYYASKKYEYYSCYSRFQKNRTVAKSKNCQNKTWRMEELDNIIFDEIKKLALDPNYISEIKENSVPDDRTQVIEKEIVKLETQINRLLDLYTIGQIPVDTLQDRIHNLNEHKESLEIELDSIKKENESKISHENVIKLAESFV